MRVWDVPPSELCSRHLVGEHAEIHAVWSVIVNDKRGYAGHPEVSRWRGRLPALALRHDLVARELQARGFNHASPLQDVPVSTTAGSVPLLVSLEQQRELLRRKGCACGAYQAAGSAADVDL
jgi:hypothetical protein